MTDDQNIIVLSSGVIENDYRIEAFFDYLEDETKTGETQITDNWVESNYSIQDHIAISPKIYRLKGYVGEVIFQNQSSWLYNLLDKRTIDKLFSIFQTGSALAPTVGSYTRSVINAIVALNKSVDRYRQIINTFKNKYLLKGKRQNTCNSALFHIMDRRVPVTLTNLAFERKSGKDYTAEYYIQSIKSHQGNSRFKSDFEVVLKEIRIAGTTYTKIDKATLEQANAVQAAPEVYTGVAAKEEIAVGGGVGGGGGSSW